MITAFWNMLCESAIFILVGFVIAALMQAFLPTATVLRYLRRSGTRSVVLATILGAPLPLCSCSVLPTVVTLRRKGASAGSTLSFLISTPETSVTSVLLTWGLLGPVLAVVRPVAACVTAITAGLAANVVERNGGAKPVEEDPLALAPTPVEEDPDGCGDDCCCAPADLDDPQPEHRSWQQRLRDGLRFAFVDLYDDIFGWIMIGILVAAVLQVLVPTETLLTVLGGPVQSMLLMVVIGVPLYVCAEASTPIAAALVASGMNPGAALVFLLVGPATNAGSLGLLDRLLGRRMVVVYLLAIIVVAVVLGWGLDVMLAATGVEIIPSVLQESYAVTTLKALAGVVFLAMGLLTIRRRRWLARIAGWLDARLPGRITPGRAVVILLGLAALIWLLSGFFVVRAGELAAVRRFGQVIQSDLGPGLHVSWPAPIDRVDVVDVQRVRRMVLGYADGDGEDTPWLTDLTESRFLIGDENVADFKLAVHWGVEADGLEAWLYAVADREELVRSATLAALRETLAGASITSIFTAGRAVCEREVAARTRARLASYGCGIRLHDFSILDAHAPSEVHASFRDVASALEDRATTIDIARADEARLIPAARAEAEARLSQASSYRTEKLARARGEASAFVGLRDVARDWPAVTRSRLRFEAIEKVLPGIRAYIKPPGDPAGGGEDGGRLDIWLVDPRTGSAVTQSPRRRRRSLRDIRGRIGRPRGKGTV